MRRGCNEGQALRRVGLVGSVNLWQIVKTQNVNRGNVQSLTRRWKVIFDVSRLYRVAGPVPSLRWRSDHRTWLEYVALRAVEQSKMELYRQVVLAHV